MDLGFAIVTAMIYNRGRNKDDPAKTPQDFLPEFYKTPGEKRREMEAQVAQFMAGASAPSGAIQRGSAQLRKING